MHFRERGASTQLIRTGYDEGTKRSTQEVVGRLPRATLRLSDDVAAKLTPAERAEVDAYIERSHSIDLLRRKVAAHTLARTAEEAIEYARGVDDPAERDLLQAVFAETILMLRRGARTATDA